MDCEKSKPKYFKDEKRSIYCLFILDYRNIFGKYNNNYWYVFVNMIGLGLLYAGRKNECDLYKIVDEKKWLLTKIRYGL